MRLVLTIIAIIYAIGVGVALSPTIRATPATYLSARIGREMFYALAWPARDVHDASVGTDSPLLGPRPPEG
jgi:hypothetical protein